MPRRTIILTSVLVGIIALIGGILGIASRSTSYEATAEISVVPKATTIDESIAAVNTLSRGPVTANYAEAYASSRVIDRAFAAAGITAEEAERVSVTASVVTDTSFILVMAEAGEPVLAERAANAVASTSPELTGYDAAFGTEVFDSADGTATRAGPGTITLLLIAIVVAAVLAFSTAAVLGRIFRGSRGSATASFGGPEDVTMTPRGGRSKVSQES